MLERLGERGLIKARGQQRTAFPHVLAAIRTLNRLEFVGETLRAALHTLAQAAPAWLARHGRPEWAERTGARVEPYRSAQEPGRTSGVGRSHWGGWP